MRMYIVFCWFFGTHHVHSQTSGRTAQGLPTSSPSSLSALSISFSHASFFCLFFLLHLPFGVLALPSQQATPWLFFRCSPFFWLSISFSAEIPLGSHESLQGMEECLRRAGLVRCTSHRRTRHGHSTGWSWSLEGLARNSRSNWNMSNHVTSIHLQQKDVHWQWVAWVAMETADSVPSGMRNYLRLPEMRWLKAHEAFTMNNLIFAESHRWETLKCITLLATQLATSSTCIAGYLLFSLGTDVTFIHFYCDFVFAR